MCCFFTVFLFLGPRFANVIWWIANPARWDLAFSSVVWPILGIIFAPWTTMVYMLFFVGGIAGFEWFWIVLAVLADIGMYVGGGAGNRDRVPGL
ncbi:MAG TPA: hypothetical protein VFI27_03895 [candidate division Zixibacteria bacterium]|nr:hypothetical protein [candidate division Zixibacteria bacterium]